MQCLSLLLLLVLLLQVERSEGGQKKTEISSEEENTKGRDEGFLKKVKRTVNNVQEIPVLEK